MTNEEIIFYQKPKKGDKKPRKVVMKPKSKSVAPKPKKDVPKIRVTKAVLKKREDLYKMISKVWCQPNSVKHGNVSGYIRGLITYERVSDKETDHELIQELQDLIILWRIRAGE